MDTNGNTKELLIKDLCSRLPYGVKGRVSRHDSNNRECEFVATIDGKLYDRFAVAQESWFDNVTIKPYLFPLSSMTNEQKREFDISMDMGYAAAYNAEINCANRMIDFFNKYHLDYRGLIPMGLANDATGLNIY